MDRKGESTEVEGAGVTVREAGPRDYRRAYPVLRETFELHRAHLPDIFQETHQVPPTRDFLEDMVYGGEGAFFLAEAGTEVVGALTVRLAASRSAPFLVPGRRAVVDTLGVTRAWRGRGIGRMLMEAAEAWATRQGATEVQLTVWEFNTGALGFYDALGYGSGNRMLRKPLPQPHRGEEGSQGQE
jgi:ribosomal protein S18 acetylase RimI-like enzyme